MHLKYIFIFLSIGMLSCADKPNNTQNNPVVLTDNELLDKAQQDAFNYFWDYAETNSKLARERYHVDEPFGDANLVTTGGSGFGLMNLIVGVVLFHSKIVSNFLLCLFVLSISSIS